MSTKSGMHFGRIFIPPDHPHFDFNACIHEELFQVMGLVNDAQDSKKFNFDNLGQMKPTKYDELLLKSLYSDNIYTGSRTQDVVDIFEEFLNKK